jgi:hypothetical protein
MTIPAVHNWPTNADLIADVAKLDYIRKEDLTVDVTYGKGNWWTKWAPKILVCHDKYTLDGVDFRDLPHPYDHFDCVAFDPPYKLNGTPALDEFDKRYGVDKKMTWQEKHAMIQDGIRECSRVLKRGGHLLLKCQDQVCSGAIRWQTIYFTSVAEATRLILVDRFDMIGGGRPQPAGRRQVHAQGRPSTLLVFRKR